MRKSVVRVVAAVLAMTIAIQPAFAFWGFLAPVTSTVMWLGRVAAGNVTAARAWEWSITGHAAAITAIWYAMNDSSQTGTKPATQVIPATIIPQLDPKAQRQNPDTRRYNDPAAGSRDPSPKSSYSTADAKPGNGSADAFARVGVGTYTYQNTDGTVVDVVVAQYYQSGLSQAQAETAYKNSVGTTYSGWAGSGIYISGTDWRYVWTKNRPASCATGYSLSNGVCTLQNVEQVMKPANTVGCEVVRNNDGTWEIDPKNPTCVDLASKITANGRTLSINKGDGTNDTIKTNDDGTTTIKTGNRQIDLDPPGTDGSSRIRGITDGGQDTGGGGTGGTGTGTGGTGTSGTGGGSCGGSGQVPCAIDGSGLDGKSADLTAAGQALDTANSNIMSAIQERMPTAPSWSWALPVQPVACSALQFNILGRQWTINWCPYIPLMQQAISYLAYCFTALHLFNIVMRPTKRA